MKFTAVELPKPATKTLIYGVGGVGKTTLAASAPGAFLIPVEAGANWLSVPRTEQPKTFGGLMSLVDGAASAKKGTLETLVVDTVDAVEQLIWDMVLKKHPGTGSLMSIPYGKGFPEALQLGWIPLLAALDRVVNTGVAVVLVAHEGVQKFRDGTGGEWDRFAPRLHQTAADRVFEWVDDAVFLKFDDVMVSHGKEKGEKKTRIGVTGDDRLICAVHSATYRAKTRTGLPAVQKMDLMDPWSAMIRPTMDMLYAAIQPETAAQIREWVADDPRREEAARVRLRELGK